MNFGPSIVTDGLIFQVDAGNDQSYVSGSNSTIWKDLKKTTDVTLLNGPTFSTDNLGCIVFDGDDDNSQFANILNNTSNSICAWVYNTTLSQDATVIGNWGEQFILYMDTGGAGDGYRVLYSTDGSGTKGSSADNVNAIQDQWQYVVCTFTTTSVSLYVDGNHIQTTTFAAAPVSSGTSNIAIGADQPNGQRDWPGRIANVSMYDKALSAEEVLQNYNALKPRFGL